MLKVEQEEFSRTFEARCNLLALVKEVEITGYNPKKMFCISITYEVKGEPVQFKNQIKCDKLVNIFAY